MLFRPWSHVFALMLVSSEVVAHSRQGSTALWRRLTQLMQLMLRQAPYILQHETRRVWQQQAKTPHVSEGLPDWETKRAERGGHCATFARMLK